MVVFNCNACGETLKKNQVEKHTLRCRHCEALSCVDCGKDFWGNDYQAHTKCMTEDEKYCGKNYVPKVNKGEVKQEQWIEKVQNAIDKSISNPNLKGLLERLKDYPNIPRKKVKFVNFLKNSLRIHNESLINQVWDTLMAAGEQESSKQNGNEKAKTPNESVTDRFHEDSVKADGNEGKSDKTERRRKNENVDNTDDKTEKGKKHKLSEKVNTENALQEVEDANINGESNAAEHKLSKRERKEERRKKANKKEKKDKNENNDNTEENRKGKKRKLSENEEIVGDHVVTEKKGKKKAGSEVKESDDVHRTSECDNSDDEVNGKGDEEITEQKKKKRKKAKFNWEATILAVLQSKGEMSLKKLQKKVLNEFAALDAANYSEDNLRAKFDKKVNKIAQVKVFKDRVKLK